MNIENQIVIILSLALGILSAAMIIIQLRINRLSKKVLSELIEEKIQQLQESMFLLFNIEESIFKTKDFLCQNVGDNPCELDSEIIIQEDIITEKQLFMNYQER